MRLNKNMIHSWPDQKAHESRCVPREDWALPQAQEATGLAGQGTQRGISDSTAHRQPGWKAVFRVKHTTCTLRRNTD